MIFLSSSSVVLRSDIFAHDRLLVGLLIFVSRREGYPPVPFGAHPTSSAREFNPYPISGLSFRIILISGVFSGGDYRPSSQIGIISAISYPFIRYRVEFRRRWTKIHGFRGNASNATGSTSWHHESMGRSVRSVMVESVCVGMWTSTESNWKIPSKRNHPPMDGHGTGVG